MTDNEEQDETMNCGLSVAERNLLQMKLRELSDTVPPRAVWTRIEEQARAEGLFSGHRHQETLKWIAGAAVAATVAMMALNLPLTEPTGETVPTSNDGSESIVPRDLNALKVESQLLERNLRLLPQDPAVMKVSTVTTIRELEDRISAIDYRLNDRTIKLEPVQEEIYWRERVRLMGLLVQLRSAQAQRLSF